MAKILVFICKNFRGLVQAIREGRKWFLETADVELEGDIVTSGAESSVGVVLSAESSETLSRLQVAGYTVTAFIFPDAVLVPFFDEFLHAVADLVNGQIWSKKVRL